MSLLASVFGTATTQSELSVFLDPPPELAVKDSARSTRLIPILLRLAKRRKKDDPYPDSRTVVQRLALKYRYQLSQWWEYGVKAFIIEGFESTDPSVIQATLRIVENWLVPCSTQNSDITPLEVNTSCMIFLSNSELLVILIFLFYCELHAKIPSGD
eukprot:UN22470